MYKPEMSECLWHSYTWHPVVSQGKKGIYIRVFREIVFSFHLFLVFTRPLYVISIQTLIEIVFFLRQNVS